MIKISRKLKAYEKEELLNLQNQRRQKYGLPPLKTIKIENLIHIPTEKTKAIPPNQEGGMYQ